ncbi:hypothetical protein [Gryllotalpicola protaetiae]|uniref:Uncharacterized protein n=1 Tax=Gryllotalpicola protaetiae TaxID=2419771 RepID=A0A387BNT1_9MICO|nr:hypothetical protein [Gryllotalpicola protaetiae]AYG02779.1 hypothetical protein D7I44_04090 [Gryllotalpicola protaetiae]
MTVQLRTEFGRWSRWYPAQWRVDKSAAMLSAYLDQAEGEGRDRLTRSEKMGLVVGGIGARLDTVAPGRVRDQTATVMATLLGAFGLMAGIVMEWAPGNPGPHLSGRFIGGASLELTFAPGPATQRAFGPFESPFIIVCALAVAAWLLSMIGAERAYRWLLATTAVTGLAAAVIAEPYFHFYGWPWDFGLPGLFVAVVALMALAGGRPRSPWRVAVGTLLWACVFAVGFLTFPAVGSFVDNYRNGAPTSAFRLFELTFWTRPVIIGPTVKVSGTGASGAFEEFGVVPAALAAIAIALVGAQALALAARLAMSATIALSTIPWGVFLAWLFVTELTTQHAVPYAGERRLDYLILSIDALVLAIVYAAAVAVAAHYRRRSRSTASVDIDPTPIGR